MTSSKEGRVPITLAQTNEILRRQSYQCANKPGSINEIEGYECLLWSSPEYQGRFDSSGHEIDHILPHALSHGLPDINHVDNLQALCGNCHRKKTQNQRPIQVARRRILKMQLLLRSGTKRKTDASDVDISTTAKRTRLSQCGPDLTFLCDTHASGLVEVSKRLALPKNGKRLAYYVLVYDKNEDNYVRSHWSWQAVKSLRNEIKESDLDGPDSWNSLSDIFTMLTDSVTVFAFARLRESKSEYTLIGFACMGNRGGLDCIYHLHVFFPHDLQRVGKFIVDEMRASMIRRHDGNGKEINSCPMMTCCPTVATAHFWRWLKFTSLPGLDCDYVDTWYAIMHSNPDIRRPDKERKAGLNFPVNAFIGTVTCSFTNPNVKQTVQDVCYRVYTGSANRPHQLHIYPPAWRFQTAVSWGPQRLDEVIDELTQDAKSSKSVADECWFIVSVVEADELFKFQETDMEQALIRADIIAPIGRKCGMWNICRWSEKSLAVMDAFFVPAPPAKSHSFTASGKAVDV